jgi:hypothetical protein
MGLISPRAPLGCAASSDEMRADLVRYAGDLRTAKALNAGLRAIAILGMIGCALALAAGGVI